MLLAASAVQMAFMAWVLLTTFNLLNFYNEKFNKVGDPTSCTRWTLCVNGVEIAQECAPGTAFDASIGRCNLAELVTCDANTCAKLESGVGMAPAPDSCVHYNYCFGGQVLERGQCPPGLMFDIVSKRCVRSGEGTCQPGTTFRRASALIST